MYHTHIYICIDIYIYAGNFNLTSSGNVGLFRGLCTQKFSMSTTKLNGPICEGHCVDPTTPP